MVVTRPDGGAYFAGVLQPVVVERVVSNHKGPGGCDTDCEEPRQNSSEYIHFSAPSTTPSPGGSHADNATSLGAFSDDAMAAYQCCKSSTLASRRRASSTPPRLITTEAIVADVPKKERVAARRPGEGLANDFDANRKALAFLRLASIRLMPENSATLAAVSVDRVRPVGVHPPRARDTSPRCTDDTCEGRGKRHFSPVGMFGRQLPVQVRALHRLLHNQWPIHDALPVRNAVTIESNWGYFKAQALRVSPVWAGPQDDAAVPPPPPRTSFGRPVSEAPTPSAWR
jgi:hypothetical protein